MDLPIKYSYEVLEAGGDAPGPAESLRAARAGALLVSFSEVRRNLSGKAGKRGGESRPQSLLSSAHGGKILQDFFRNLHDLPLFPAFPL